MKDPRAPLEDGTLVAVGHKWHMRYSHTQYTPSIPIAEQRLQVIVKHEAVEVQRMRLAPTQEPVAYMMRDF